MATVNAPNPLVPNEIYHGIRNRAKIAGSFLQRRFVARSRIRNVRLGARGLLASGIFWRVQGLTHISRIVDRISKICFTRVSLVPILACPVAFSHP